MRAMILAAGLGTRMRPLTLLRAKPALPVLNRPLLFWTLDQLRRAGVSDVMINLHHRPESIRSRVGDGRRFGLRVRYSYERRILGGAGGPRRVRDFFGKEPFLLLNGDMVFDFDLRAFMRAHRRSGARVTLALWPHPDPRHYGSVVTNRAGRVLSVAGLPRPAKGRVSHFIGVQALDPSLLDALPRGRSETARDLWAPLLRAGAYVRGVRVRTPWYDLSSPPLYLASQLSLLRRGFRGARGRLVAPTARIDPRARVTRSVIGDGARIEAGAVVQDSVLWEGVRVAERARVIGSIVADGVRVARGEALRGAVAWRGNKERLEP